MNNSRRKVASNVTDKINTLFYEVLTSSKSPEDFELILSGLLSLSEKLMIRKRVIIIYLLLKGIDTTTICKTIKVTRTTVAKCAIFMENNPKIKNRLTKNLAIDRIKILFEELLVKTIFAPGTPGINWTASRQWEKSIQEKKRKGV